MRFIYGFRYLARKFRNFFRAPHPDIGWYNRDGRDIIDAALETRAIREQQSRE